MNLGLQQSYKKVRFGGYTPEHPRRHETGIDHAGPPRIVTRDVERITLHQNTLLEKKMEVKEEKEDGERNREGGRAGGMGCGAVKRPRGTSHAY